MKKVDIIIPIYFAPDLTIRCTESVVYTTRKLNYDIKIILVDDSESDVFHKILKDGLKQKGILEEVVLIKRKKNGGFIEACYTGIEYRDSDYKILLNSDTLVIGNWLTEMIQTAESDEKIALVNPITNNTPVINVEMPEGFNIHLMNNYFSHSKFSNSDYIDVVTIVGFCLLIKSTYIKKYGFFDRIFDKGYGEETDLHFRYVGKGLRAVISPKSFVYHRGEASFSDRDQRVLKNREIFFKRHKLAYEKAYPEFQKRTILHEIRRNIQRIHKLNYDVIILIKNNDFLTPSSYFAHKLANILNEIGVSTTIVVETKYDRTNQIEDRLYNSIQIDSLLSKEFTTKLIVTEPSLLSEAIKLQSHSIAEPEIKLLESYTTNSIFDKKTIELLQKVGITTISSINDLSATRVPLAGSLEYLGAFIKKQKILGQTNTSKAIVISDDQNDFNNSIFQDLFGGNVTYIYTGTDEIKNEKYIYSYNISDNDILRIFSSHSFMFELRKNIFFSEIHLNFILAGGYVVTENLLLPANLPKCIKNRIILPSEISSVKPELNYKIPELIKYTDRNLIQKYKINIAENNNFDANYYKNILKIFLHLEKHFYSKHIVYHTISIDDLNIDKTIYPSYENVQNIVPRYRIRYIVADATVEFLCRKIPKFYIFLKFAVQSYRRLIPTKFRSKSIQNIQNIQNTMGFRYKIRYKAADIILEILCKIPKFYKFLEFVVRSYRILKRKFKAS